MNLGSSFGEPRVGGRFGRAVSSGQVIPHPVSSALICGMNDTLNWLKQYVDFNWSPEELTERLTMLGLATRVVAH